MTCLGTSARIEETRTLIVRLWRRPIMLYAVTVEPLNTICFVSERPDDNPWEVQEGVALDITLNFNIGPWDPEGSGHILCVSTSDPKYYKLFKNTRDIDPAQFRPAGRHFGGLFSKPSWERFAKHAPAFLAALDVSVEEPPGATEEAVAMIKRGG
jgi:hypothetical protein